MVETTIILTRKLYSCNFGSVEKNRILLNHNKLQVKHPKIQQSLIWKHMKTAIQIKTIKEVFLILQLYFADCTDLLKTELKHKLSRVFLLPCPFFVYHKVISYVNSSMRTLQKQIVLIIGKIFIYMLFSSCWIIFPPTFLTKINKTTLYLAQKESAYFNPLWRKIKTYLISKTKK